MLVHTRYMLAKVGVSLEDMNVTIQGINTFLLVKDTILYYTGSNASLAEKITSADEATGGILRLGKNEILKLLDNFADDIAADVAATTLAAQLGKTRTIEAMEAGSRAG